MTFYYSGPIPDAGACGHDCANNFAPIAVERTFLLNPSIAMDPRDYSRTYVMTLMDLYKTESFRSNNFDTSRRLRTSSSVSAILRDRVILHLDLESFDKVLLFTETLLAI